MPIFILINNYTASAAEILAGCLKIHSENLSKEANHKNQKKLMVFLVGSKTFGKGSVQEVIPVSNNCALKVTTSLYYLPNDISIQGIGIEPDFVIEKKMPTPELVVWSIKNGHECALTNYIKIDGKEDKDTKDKNKKDKKSAEDKKEKERKSWAERAKTMLESDNQLRDTISLINLLYTGKTSCPQNVTNRAKAIEFLKSNFITDEKLNLVEVKI